MKLKIAISSVLLTTLTIYASTLEGYVWNDTNGNGIKDNGEPFINNLTVKLFKHKDGSKNMATKTRDGKYKFNLPDANARYRLNIYTQNGLTTKGLKRKKGDKAFRSSYLKIDALDNYTKVGVTSDVKSVIKGYIWDDKNRDGKKNNGEKFLNNITVKLFKYKDGSKNMATKTENGQYHFSLPDVNSRYRLNIYTQNELTTRGLKRKKGDKAFRSSYLKIDALNSFTKVGISSKIDVIDAIELSSGNSIEGLSVKQDKWSYFKIEASDGDSVTTILNGLDRDANLYVKIGAKPTKDSNDCKSTHSRRTTDSCSVTLSQNETVYIGVYGDNTTNFNIVANVKNNHLVYPPDRKFKEIPTKSGVAQPNYLKSYKDPIFHSKVTRITNRENQQSDYGNFPVKTKQGTAWNSDMTMLRLKYRLYDAKTFKELSVTSGESKNSAYRILGSPRYGAGDIRWSKRDPNLMYLLNSSKKFVSIKVNSRKSRISLEKSFIDLSKYEDVSIGHGEGNLAYKDRYILFSAKKYHDDNVYALLYHIGDKRVKWERKVPHTRWSAKSGERGYFDWITVDPLSKYIVASMNKKMYLYDMNLKHEKVFANTASHGDLGVDINGDPTYVQFVFDGERGIWSYNLRTLAKTKLLPKKYGGGHISCRNYQRQGWCYLSTSKEGYREIIALKLDDGTGTVERFVQTRTHHDHHDLTEVNVSPDGTKVLFSSDWGDKDNILELYHASYP